VGVTSKRSYALISRRDGRAYDVEMIEPGAVPRVVNTFNREADAWDWINEQRYVDRFMRRMARNPSGRGAAD
jgi:hypothetical protein